MIKLTVMKSGRKNSRLIVAAVQADSGVGRGVLRGIALGAEHLGLAMEHINKDFVGGSLAPFAELLRAADGAIVRTRDTYASARQFLRPEVPVVGIDILPFWNSGLWATLNPQNEKIGALAADELLASDCRCYAFVPALPKMPWGDARGKGFLDRIRAAGGDARRYEPKDTWYSIAERESLADWLSKLPRPFGIFARNDLIARNALGVCKKAGIEVPREAKIIGADNDESLCLYSSPQLSSVRIDHEGAGRRAVDVVQSFFGKPRPPRPSSLRFGFYGVARRASTGIAESSGDLRLEVGFDYIAGHFWNQYLGAGDVAAAMGISRRQAERLFNAAGTSIHQKLDETRLAHVKSLLSETDEPLRAIAEECGYSSGIYLSGLFKQRFGITPGQFRAQRTANRGEEASRG